VSQTMRMCVVDAPQRLTYILVCTACLSFVFLVWIASTPSVTVLSMTVDSSKPVAGYYKVIFVIIIYKFIVSLGQH